MRALGRTFHRFDDPMFTTAGLRFFGSIAPVPRDRVPGNALIEARLLLRVRSSTPLNTRDTIRDSEGRVFLVADHDRRPGEHIFKLVQMTEQVAWKRTVTTTEAVTGLPKAASESNLGPVWAAVEVYGQERTDLGLRVMEDKRRIITGAALQLGDKVADSLVRRIWTVFGVTVGEIQ